MDADRGIDDVTFAEGVPDALDGDPNLRPSVRTGLSLAALSFASAAGISLVSSVVTSRLYGVSTIGQYALATAPYVITSQLSQINEGTAFVREAAVLPARGIRVSTLFRLVLAFSMVLTLAVSALIFGISTLLLRGPVGQPDLVLPALVVMAAYVLVENISWNIDALLSAFRAGRVLFLARTAQLSTFLVGSVAAASLTRSVWGMVGATVLSFVVAFAIRLRVLFRYITFRVPAGAVRETLPELPGLLRFGLVLVPGTLLSSLANNLGTWVVGSLESVSVTGAYARSLSLATRFNDAAYRIGEILMPGMVERAKRGDDQGAVALLDRATRLAGVAVLALAAGGGGAAVGILGVFGPGFARGASILTLLALAHALLVVNYVQNQGLLASGHPGRITRQSVISATLIASTMWPLHAAFGAAGIAGAYVVAKLTVVVVADRVLGRTLARRPALLGIGRLACLGASWGAGWLAARSLVAISTSLVVSALAAAAGALTTVVVARVLGVLPADEWDRGMLLVRRATRRARSRAGHTLSG